MAAFDYAPAPESRSIVDIKPSYGLFINGAFTAPRDGGSRKTVNPATEEVLADIAEAGESDVDDAVRAARHAYDTVWGPMRGADRAMYIFRIARIIQERSRELAVLESIDNGKPVSLARSVDIPRAMANFKFYATAAMHTAICCPVHRHRRRTATRPRARRASAASVTSA